MTNDIMDQLRNYRPDVQGLERRWPADSRNALAERILGDAPDAQALLRHRPRSRRSRLIVTSTLVAAAVAAAITVPALVPDGAPGAASPAAAAALRRLAHTAASAAADVATPGQFVYTVTREHTVGMVDDDQGKPVDATEYVEVWTASDGRLWQRQTSFASGAQTLYFPARDGDTKYLASLPTEPDQLERYLRKNASGSNSTDEAVFVAVGDTLRQQNVPADLRSAAVAVLARTDHVTLGVATSDELGRRVQEFDYTDDTTRPGVVESLFFDPRTAELIAERTSAPNSTNTTLVVRSYVVNSVPAQILRTAIPQK